MRRLIYLMLCGVVLLSVQACSERQGKNYNEVVLVDQNGVLFIKNGIEGGMKEIKAAGLVITQSENQKVIDLAKTMIDDHTRIVEELKRLEHDKQIVETDTISPADEQMITILSNKKGVDFDQDYLNMMVTDHIQDIKLFTNAASNRDTDIKSYAVKNLPVIQEHLDQLKKILPRKK